LRVNLKSISAKDETMRLTYNSSVLSVLFLAASALAQTPTTPPATTTNPCPSTSPPNLASFSVERVLDPTQILSTFTPTFPAQLPAAISSKAMELHQSFIFNAQNQLLTVNLFALQSGSPLPTPPNTIPQSSVLEILALKADKVYTSCTPNPSVMFTGSVATDTPPSPFGNMAGIPAAMSIGFTSDTPPKINNVVLLLAGTAVEYSAAGAGTITFTQTSVTPPGSTSGPTIVIVNPSPVAVRVVNLDASGTTSPNTPLTFQWTVVAGAASITNATQAVATAFLEGSIGTYTFQVTVTDSKGNVSTGTVNIQFL
jgi:hypothetical protein